MLKVICSCSKWKKMLYLSDLKIAKRYFYFWYDLISFKIEIIYETVNIYSAKILLGQLNRI